MYNIQDHIIYHKNDVVFKAWQLQTKFWYFHTYSKNRFHDSKHNGGEQYLDRRAIHTEIEFDIWEMKQIRITKIK